MLAHLLNAAVRALAVTVVLGSILVYAVGGLESPNAPAMIGVIAVSFFLFWITFFFLFGSRVPKHDSRRQDRDLDETGSLSLRVRKGRDDENGDGAGDGDNGD